MEKIISSLASVLLVLMLPSLVVSCYKAPIHKNQPRGVYHLVKKNETVPMIGRAYNVSPQSLVKTNKIKNVNSVKEGSVLFIPNANQVIEIKADADEKDKVTDAKSKINEDDNIDNQDIKKIKISEEAVKVNKEKDPLPAKQYSRIQQTQIQQIKETEKPETVKSIGLADEKIKSLSKEPMGEEKIQTDKKRFIWPVKGAVKAQFGIQPNKTFHNWIKIVAKAGTKVKAAASGTVIFSSNLKNYGETIIIRHKENYATVYTHLKKRYVKMDQNIKKGETIALLGEKDYAGDSYMNFEIRLKGKARNPMLFLP